MSFLQQPTPRQKAILDFIKEFQREQGFPPSRREIATGVGLSSVATVQEHVEALEKKGLLKLRSEMNRGIEAMPDPEHEKNDRGEARALPLVGQVAAGIPIEAINAQELVDVPNFMLKKGGGEYFVLKVKGWSMIEDGIFDQDYVVIKKQSTAQNGDTVVALINNEATIKRYQKKQGVVELHPANPEFKTIVVNGEQEFKIEGVLAGIMRRYGK
ncbi:MAG: transcriptional repressor LexA [Xanthomonadaceae bacterium]|nr:transcriptional repressor LexA [Xanthomonadaceae bacterium]